MSVSSAWETVSAQVVRAWPIHEREKLHRGKKYAQPPRFVICHVGPSWSAVEVPSEAWGFHSISSDRASWISVWLTVTEFCFVSVSTACVSVSWLPWNINIMPLFICQWCRQWNVRCNKFKPFLIFIQIICT